MLKLRLNEIGITTNCYICKKDLGSDDVFTSLNDTADVTLRERLKNQLGLSENDIICFNCIDRIAEKFKEKALVNLADVRLKPTFLLWLVPIFMGLLGGILMYIAVKDQDQLKANRAILVGIIPTVVIIIIYFTILTSMFY